MNKLSSILLMLAVCGSAVTMFASGVGMRGTESTDETVARAYVEAYGRGDLTEMTTYMAEDMTLTDATAADFGVTMHEEGRRQILDRIGPMFEAAGDVHLKIERWFYSGNHGVCWGTYTHDAPLPGGDAVEINADIVLVVQMRDGKVVSQVDHADYASVMRQVEAHQAPTNPS